MPPEVLAGCAALGFASGAVALKFVTHTPNLMAGFLTTLFSGILTVGLISVVLVDGWAVSSLSLSLFALGGLAGPGLGRIFLIRAVRDAGASVAVPVQTSTTPLISSAAGAIIFGEIIGPARLIGLALVLGGIWACVYGGSANQVPVAYLKTSAGQVWGRYRMLLFPLAAGLAYAVMDIFTKSALVGGGEPLVGAFVGLTAAFVFWLLIYLIIPRFRQRVLLTRELLVFCVSGVFTAAAIIALMYALRAGDLSVVAPIVASQPVIVVLLAGLLLRNFEVLRKGTILGAVLLFAGAALLSTS